MSMLIVHCLNQFMHLGHLVSQKVAKQYNKKLEVNYFPLLSMFYNITLQF